MDRAYAVSLRVINVILVLVGLTMIVSTLVRGGGPLAVGVVFGVLLAALGAGRLWLARGGTS